MNKILSYITTIEVEESSFLSAKKYLQGISLILILYISACFLSIFYGLTAINIPATVALFLSLVASVILLVTFRIQIIKWHRNKLGLTLVLILQGFFLTFSASFGSIGETEYTEQGFIEIQKYAQEQVDDWKKDSEYKSFQNRLLKTGEGSDLVETLNNEITNRENEVYLNALNKYSESDPFIKLRSFYGLATEKPTYLVFFLLLGLPFIVLQIFPIIEYNKLQNRLTKLTEEKKALIQNQIGIFSAIQHELGNKLPALKHDITDIKEYFNSNSQNGKYPGIKDSIREALPGESEEDIDTIEKVIARIESKLNYAINVVDSANGIISSDPSRYKPKETKLLSFLRQEVYKHLHKADNFKFTFTGDEDILVNLDEKQFGVLINNFIANAIRHGFKGRDKEYRIVFNVGEDFNNIILVIRNNGEPFPPKFTLNQFKQPFSYSGKSGNTGFGGFIISNILHNHNATLDFRKDIHPNDEFKVQFVIKFAK